MYNNNGETPIVCGVVVHILPENLPLFIDSIQNSPHIIRLIIHKESNDKLWLTGGTHE